MNSGHSQTHGLGKVMGTEVIEAFGLSNAYYILSLWRANGVMVDNWNHHPQTHLLEGNFFGGQTRSCWASRFTQGPPGPHTLTQQSVTA